MGIFTFIKPCMSVHHIFSQIQLNWISQLEKDI